MPKGGLEPPRVAPYAPQTYVSTNSTTSAKIKLEGNQYHFFAGEAAGFTDTLVLGEACGEASGLAETLALGDGLTATLAAGAGVGIVAPDLSLTTDDGPLNPGNENNRASSMKIAADTIVAFSRGFCAPRGPKAVWLPAPPKAAATSPPFPDCNKITNTRNRQSITKSALRP